MSSKNFRKKYDLLNSIAEKLTYQKKLPFLVCPSLKCKPFGGGVQKNEYWIAPSDSLIDLLSVFYKGIISEEIIHLLSN